MTSAVNRRMTLPHAALLWSAYFLFCLVVQASTGAWQAGFVAYADEPSHFVGAVMIHDWLRSGQWFTPSQFARDYYNHYPFFAVGYWPPLFYLLTGVLFLVAGVGRMQALLVPAACAATTAWLVFRLLKHRAGTVAAVCAGFLYLSLPAVQACLCSFMVDHLTACLCIAASVCFVRYLERPGYRNGILSGVSCAGAILSKYSAAYIAALPWVAILLLRRTGLLRKPSFLIQPIVIALMVGPWALWTWRLAFYGLLAHRPALTASRAVSIIVTTFEIFPPVLMGVVVLGLLALLFRRRAWQEDVGLLGLLCAGHLAFLFVSPVLAEPRYLLAPAASLLVLSCAGWAATLPRLAETRRFTGAITASTAVLTSVFVLVYFGSYPRPAQHPIRPIVETVLKNKAWAGQRLVVPSDLEGPFIAEFVAQERPRPASYLLRPDKILASSDWFGGHYTPFFATPEQMMEYFRRNPVRLIIWHDQPGRIQVEDQRVLGEMLRKNPLVWRNAEILGSAGGATASWAVYEYVPPR
jgi:4-amino-4-deoxy-L-arabinose transferase-like glycosyltransferase